MSDIFSDKPISEDPVEVTVETLVGEGRKYSDPNELAKAYVHADSYIEQQKARIAELEAEVKIRSELQNNVNKPNDGQGGNQDGHRQPDQDSLANKDSKDVDIQSLVREEMKNATAEEKSRRNVDQAAAKMIEVFGSPAKANEALIKRAKELDVSVEWLRDSAARSVPAFLASMGINNQRPTSTPFTYGNDVNRHTPPNNNKNYRYFEEIRKANPNRYYSRAVQEELFAARRELGDTAFYI